MTCEHQWIGDTCTNCGTAYHLWIKRELEHQTARALKAEQQRDTLLMVVKKCALRFRAYEEIHRAKQTAEGDGKASDNAMIARMCEDAMRESNT